MRVLIPLCVIVTFVVLGTWYASAKSEALPSRTSHPESPATAPTPEASQGPVYVAVKALGVLPDFGRERWLVKERDGNAELRCFVSAQSRKIKAGDEVTIRAVTLNAVPPGTVREPDDPLEETYNFCLKK